MIQLALSLALALGAKPTQQPQQKPQQQPQQQPQAHTPAVPLALGPPKLLDVDLRDGGFLGIDKGVMVEFAAQGRRYEAWQIHKGSTIDHVAILAFDAAGNELWRTPFRWGALESWSFPLASTVDEAGDFYFMYITPGSKWRVGKATKDGAIAWHKTLYGTSWGKEATFMAPHPDGGVVILSACSGQVRDLYTARVSAAGDVLWEQKFDVGGDNQFPNALVVAQDGSIHVVGDDKKGMHVRKYAADGAIRWTKTYPRNTEYERPKGRHAFLDAAGDLVVAGTTYAGGSKEDWYFVVKYSPSGAQRLNFVRGVGDQDVKLFDHGLQGAYATHAPDGAVYFAWDHDDALGSAWTLARVDVPVGAPPTTSTLQTGPRMVKKQALVKAPTAQVSWTKTFDGEAGMSVEHLIWLPAGAVGVLGRGQRKVGTHDYRADTRLRVVTPTGADFGMAKFSSTGDFNNEPLDHALGPAGVLHVLGWQHWNGDGWNDEKVMRLRFALRP